MTRTVAALVLLLAALCWGAGNVANKTVLDHLGPLTVAGLRCALAAAVILPLLRWERRVTVGPGWWASALQVAGLFAVALLLQQVAYQTASVANASFLVNTATVMTPLLAWAVLGQRPSRGVGVAAVLTLGGALLLCGGPRALAVATAGDLICLASALGYAAWMVALGQHAVRYGRPMTTALVQFAGGAALILPPALWLERPQVPQIWLAGPELLMLGVISTALAFALMTWAQRYVSASLAAILVSAEGIFGAAGAVLVLGERLTPVAVVGAAVMLAAIMLAAGTDRNPPVEPGPSGPAGLPVLILTGRVA